METQRQTPVTVTSQGKSKRLPNFKGGVATCMSIVHVIIGVLVIIFESVAKQNNAHLSYTLMGVWTGLFFILTGCVGIGAGRTKLKRLIVTFLVLSAVCIMLAVGLMAYSGFAMALNFGGYSGIDTSDMYAASEKTPNNYTVKAENIQGEDEKPWDQGTTQYAHKSINTGMNIATLAMAGVEFIIGIISAVFCCIGYCGKPLEQTQVVYVAQSQPGTTYSATSPQGQQIIMLRQGGNGTPQLQRSLSPKETEALSQSTQQGETASTELAHPDPPPPYRDDMV